MLLITSDVRKEKEKEFIIFEVVATAQVGTSTKLLDIR